MIITVLIAQMLALQFKPAATCNPLEVKKSATLTNFYQLRWHQLQLARVSATA